MPGFDQFTIRADIFTCPKAPSLSLSQASCPHGIFKHDLKGRILFMDNAHDPLVYCNNRFKSNRSIDLSNFNEVATRFIRALIG